MLDKAGYGAPTSPTIANWILNVASLDYVVKGNITGTPKRLLFMSGW